MAKLYYNKIVKQEINNGTGLAWELSDVPELWRAEVEIMINAEDDQY